MKTSKFIGKDETMLKIRSFNGKLDAEDISEYINRYPPDKI